MSCTIDGGQQRREVGMRGRVRTLRGSTDIDFHCENSWQGRRFADYVLYIDVSLYLYLRAVIVYFSFIRALVSVSDFATFAQTKTTHM